MPNPSKKDPDPRQALFIEYYLTPASETYKNARQSAMRAGYTEEYADTILQKDLKWLDEAMSELVGKPTDKRNIVRKAKQKLDKLLDSNDDRVVADLTKFVLKTEKEYSEKQELEHTGNITIQTINYTDADNTDTPQV